MLKNKSTANKFLLGNSIQFIQIVGILLVPFLFNSIWQIFVTLLCWIYVIPPVAARLVFLAFGRPEGNFTPNDRSFWVWYYTSQLQVIYLRFNFLEEILRTLPFVYSIWLRMWGAKIGKMIYWAPAIKIMDRPYLIVGDEVIVGYGAGFTSHHLNINTNNSLIELVLKSPEVGKRVVLGGLSGLTPGAAVADGETLPSTMGLAPFYTWKGGRRHAPAPKNVPTDPSC